MSLQAVHDLIRIRALEDMLPIWSATLDLDTTALRVFGRQIEGGVVGYVPHYSHQRCYNVRLLTEANTSLSLAGELRPGNMLGIVDAIAFLQSGINKLPSRIASSRIRLRADAAFYDGDLVRFLDDNPIGYTIVGRATNRLISVMGRTSFHQLAGNWQIGKFKYQPINWTGPHRFIVARKRVALLEPPITLFTMEDYAYHILVSNLHVSPQAVWRLYNQRMSQELLIRELKNHYAMTKIPSRALIANQVYMEILLWAYDLIHLFKHLCLPSRCRQWSVSTIRRELWLLPAQLVHTQNKNRLKLPALFPHLDIFTHAYEAAEKIDTLD